MKRKIKVAVIMGGRSAEHDVSISSGKAVLDNIDRKLFSVLPVTITRSGIWKTKTTNSTIETLKKIKQVDVAFIIMHGPYGEDGTIQGLFETLNIPYTGAPVLSSALSMDKLKTKEIMKANNILIPKYISFSKEEWGNDSDKILKIINKALGLPCVVKPHNLGSSVGINIPKSYRGLKKACLEALRYSDLILVEQFIEGKEIHCGVLGNSNLQALPLDEVLPLNDFYDYKAKYKKGGAEHKMPADLSRKMTKKVQELAKNIYKLVLCRGMARVDFFVVRDKVYFNEINTIPGFTETSIFPKEARAAGISYPELITKIINFALEKK